MQQDKRYLGIPRALIPWYPRIDPDACVKGCSACVMHCKHDVYVLDGGSPSVSVANPYNCEVYCQSCQFVCDANAISFPDKASVKAVIKELRGEYPPQ
ncbi:MAG: ferredoxin family protein [Chloroflexi bacterium]|nr:ferredoxin family protein [Chloroflexota bacterium]